MPPSKRASTEELLQDLMIVQLGLAGIPQQQIREIVGVDMNRVNRIVRHLSKKSKQ
jgi:hypothetical protein